MNKKTKPKIKVTIADENPLGTIDFVEKLMEMESVICHKPRETTLYLKGELDKAPWDPDVILLNHQLLSFEQVKKENTLRNLFPSTKFLVYSVERDDIGPLKWLGIPGVFDHVTRMARLFSQKLLELDIQCISCTRGYDAAPYREKMWGMYRSKHPLGSFTASELEFLKLNARLPGLGEIAEAMALEDHAILFLLEKLYYKLSVIDRGDLAAMAIKLGLVQVEELRTYDNLGLYNYSPN